MVLRIGPVPVWVAPSELVASARAVLGWTDDAVELVAALPARVTGLLDEIDGLLLRVSRTVRDVERLVAEVGEVAAGAATVLVRVDAVAEGSAGVVERAERVTGDAALVVAEAGTTTAAAGVVADRTDGVVDAAAGVAARARLLVGEAAEASGTASRLLALYAPMAERAAPLAGRFVEEFSEDELQAAIRMVDRLPQLTHHLEADILPILATLDRVGPDVHQLLEVLQDVRLAIQGVPGFRMLRRRGEREEADGD
jgi:ABC-type transporter Mla subunit MlaD